MQNVTGCHLVPVHQSSSDGPMLTISLRLKVKLIFYFNSGTFAISRWPNSRLCCRLRITCMLLKIAAQMFTQSSGLEISLRRIIQSWQKLSETC